MAMKKSQQRGKAKPPAAASGNNANCGGGGALHRRPAHQTLKPVLPPGSAVHALYFEPGADPDSAAGDGGEWFPGTVAGCSVHPAL